MQLKEIYQFFQTPQPHFLSQELAVCYVMSVLLHGDSYGTELINQLENDYPSFRLSDTILQNTLKFLESEQVLSSYWKKVEGRGRPRRMYQLKPQWFKQASELAYLWQDYSLSHSHRFSKVGRLESRFNQHDLRRCIIEI